MTVVPSRAIVDQNSTTTVVICVSDNVKCNQNGHKFSLSFDQRPSQLLCKRLLKLRFQLCLFLFFSMFCMMFANLSLGVTLLCMTQPLSSSNESNCYAVSNYSVDESNSFLVNWTLQKQWLVMSAMSWGRLLSPAAGLLVDKFDNGLLLEMSFIGAGIASSFLPFASFKSFPVVIALRTVTGIADAVIQPCTNRFVAQWYSDRTKTNAFGWATAGRQLGALVVYPVSGFFCTQIQLFGGWPMVFYMSGLCSCLWTVFFHLFKVLRLRKRQKLMLQSAQCNLRLKRPVVPWKLVLRCSALWANIGAILCHEIPLNILFVFLPRYIRDVMKVGIQFNAMLSTLPVACFLFSKIASSQLDHIVKCKFIQVNPTRLAKVFNGLASLGLGTFLLCASFLNDDRIIMAMVCLCLCASSAGLHTPGCLSTLVTMAPSYTGSLSGFTYFFISISSILNPLVVGAIVVNERASEWGTVFQGASVVAVLPLFFFTIWGSAEEQPWCKTVSATQSTATICTVDDSTKN